MPRPKPSETLTPRTFRLSDSEYEALKQYAEARAIPINSAAREVLAALGRPTPPHAEGGKQ